MGLYDSDRRYRRRSSGGLVRAGFYLATLGVVFAFAYQIGVERTRDQVTDVSARLQETLDAKAALEQETVRLAAEAQTAEAQRVAALAQYDREVPKGDLADLLVLAAMRLDSGVSADRIAFMILSAGEPVGCSDLETKSLRLNTPSDQRSANATAKFARDRITVTGRGVAALDASGAALPEFDAAAEVTIVFTALGGAAETVAGVLPLHHSIAVGQVEHRFTITAGSPGTVDVTTDQCPMPAVEAPQ